MLLETIVLVGFFGGFVLGGLAGVLVALGFIVNTEERKDR